MPVHNKLHITSEGGPWKLRSSTLHVHQQKYWC